MENTLNNENALSLNLNDLLAAALTNVSELLKIQNERIVALEQKIQELETRDKLPTDFDLTVKSLSERLDGVEEQTSDLSDSVSDLDDKVDNLEDDIFNKVNEDDVEDKVAEAIENFDFSDIDLQPQVNKALQNVLSNILSYNK